MKYSPHEYQKYAIEFIKNNPIAAILLDMGMGKTSIVLAALNDLIFESFGNKWEGKIFYLIIDLKSHFED